MHPAIARGRAKLFNDACDNPAGRGVGPKPSRGTLVAGLTAEVSKGELSMRTRAATRHWIRRALFAASLCFATFAALAADPPYTLYVANNGIDSPGCGASVKPCRSITQAIINSSVGGMIIVGPGRYGDINGDGLYDGLGEERPRPNCRCMLAVDKRVTILSRAGAAKTIIDIGTASPTFGVEILARAAVFGGEDQGFTIRGITGVGIRIDADNGVLVSGNFVQLDNSGGGNGIFVSLGSGHMIVGNVSANNANGIVVISDSNQIRRNYAYGNTLRGFVLDGQKNLIEGNVATDNVVGFLVQGVGNLVRGNSAVGNRGPGVEVTESGAPAGTHNVAVIRNNIYGNDLQHKAFSPGCGLEKLVLGETVNASNNYWGASSGPGADPADLACVLPPDHGGLVIRPVATSEFDIPLG
jgi:parallel beta-helix repeat protein